MISAIVNLLFGCRHRHITRPITPIRKTRSETSMTYVACLGCGQRFHYDWETMRVGPVMPNLPYSGDVMIGSSVGNEVAHSQQSSSGRPPIESWQQAD